MTARERFPIAAATCAVLLLAAAVSSTACSSRPELEFADWAFPVAETTPVMEYPERPAEGTGGTVRVVEDLLIGGDPSNPEAALYRPVDVASAPDGTVYVADVGTHDIKVFESDGRFRTALGGQGQGPGEFNRLRFLTVAGDRLVAYDSRNVRLSVWRLDGRHVADHMLEATRNVTSLDGLPDGTLIVSYSNINPDRTTSRTAVHATLTGEEIEVLIERPAGSVREVGFDDPVALLQTVIESVSDARFSFVVGRQGAFYAPGSPHQVLAMSADGSARWALRRAGGAPLLPDEQRPAVIASVLARFGLEAEVGVDRLVWPQHVPSVFDLRVDGRDRLFVFRAPADLGLGASSDWPVDVYGPAGEYLASGIVPDRWRHARDDYVYEIGADSADNPVVVRYRLLVDGE